MPDTRTTLNIVIADRRPLWREALAHTIAGMSEGIRIKQHDGVAGVAERVQREGTDGAHLVVLSIDPREPEDLAHLKRICERLADTPVAVICDVESTDDIIAVLERGARAYIPSALEARIMIEALRLVSVGGTYIPESVLRLLATYDKSREAVNAARNRLDALVAECTPRQRQVLNLLCQGKANKLIAHQLEISENTVKAHLRQIMKRLRVSNRTEAVLLVSGLLTDGSRNSGTETGAQA